ncbi:hypothetical protein C8J56DRAFT_977791 [Mycena floridula]|nr:hypothetical protein C8J56DRAFT_977791 [Mycena floridula]
MLLIRQEPSSSPNLQHLAEEIYGPLLVGVLFSTLLYGANVIQAFSYYEKSKRDSVWIRGLVLFLFFSVTLGTVFNMLAVYQPLVQQFGQMRALKESPVYLRTDPIMTAIVSMPVQTFMAWRIMIITQTRLWSCIIATTAMVSFGASLFCTINVSFKPDFAQFSEFRAAPLTWLFASALADVMITGVLVHSLRVRRSGFNASLDAHLNRIIRLTVQTGALTAVFALSDALVFLILKNSTIFFSWDLSLSRLYLITVLSSLNARDSFTDRENALYPSVEESWSPHQLHGRMIFRSPPRSDMEIQSVPKIHSEQRFPENE